MPAAAAAAIGTVVAAKIASNANKHAVDVSAKGTNDALRFQKDQLAQQEKTRSANAAEWQRQYNAYLSHFYGYEAPGPAPAAAAPPAASGKLPSAVSGFAATPSFQSVPATAGSASRPGQTGVVAPFSSAPTTPTPGADIISRGHGQMPSLVPAAPLAQGGSSLADLGGWKGWSDWRRYGVGDAAVSDRLSSNPTGRG